MSIMTEPMVTLGVRVPILHYEWLIAFARHRGLTTMDGRPNISAAMREILAEAFKGTKQGYSKEMKNDSH